MPAAPRIRSHPAEHQDRLGRRWSRTSKCTSTAVSNVRTAVGIWSGPNGCRPSKHWWPSRRPGACSGKPNPAFVSKPTCPNLLQLTIDRHDRIRADSICVVFMVLVLVWVVGFVSNFTLRFMQAIELVADRRRLDQLEGRALTGQAGGACVRTGRAAANAVHGMGDSTWIRKNALAVGRST